jgi:hypothetical protein
MTGPQRPASTPAGRSARAGGRPWAALLLLAGLGLLLAGCGDDGARPNPVAQRPYLGLSPNPRPGDSVDSLIGAIQTARATGADYFHHFVTWSEFEPSPGFYDVAGLETVLDNIQRLGFATSVNLAVINTTDSEVPFDLQGLAWDDPQLVTRLDAAIDTMLSVIRRYPCVALVLGNEVDAYFSARPPSELDAFALTYAQQVLRIHAVIPTLPVGVCTISPVRNPNAGIGGRLNVSSDLMVYTYYPFEPGSDFQHRLPSTLEGDFAAMANAAGPKPWALQEIGYSSDPGNGSSPAAQAEFMTRFRNRLAAESRARLLYANWFLYTDWDTDLVNTLVGYYGFSSPGFRAYLGHLGLRDTMGVAKPAWDAWRTAP